MLSRILVEGYKSVDRIEMELGEFTLLSGVNSSGKSTIIQALLYIVQEQKRLYLNLIWKKTVGSILRE